MRDWTDVRIRVREALEANGLQSRHIVEAQKDGGGLWIGESSFDFAAADPSRLSPREYGIALGQQLVNPAVERALAYAGANSNAPVRVRLLLEASPTAPHTIRWERLFFSTGGAPWPVAISPTVAFSRYIPVEMADSEPSDEPAFRLLLAISNPSDLGPEAAIDVERELGALVDEFKDATSRLEVTVLPGRTVVSAALLARIEDRGWNVEPGMASLQNVETVAGRMRCHGIHILSHGDFKAGRSQGLLYLENAAGAVEKVIDDRLRAWIGPTLRLMVFQACRTAAAAPADQAPYVGVAAKMVKFGVPAVVAMQDFVDVEDARAFAAAFYRQLMRDGFVDEAVNAGRRAIDARGGDWSIPALFQRLTTGRLWSPDPVREAVWTNLLRIQGSSGIPETIPLKVVEQVNGIRYNPLEEPVGPVFDLDGRVQALLKTDLRICLTGPAGSNKSEQMQRLFCILGKAYLDDSSQPAPVWLGVGDLFLRGLASRKRLASAATSGSAFDRVLGAIIEGGAVPDFLLKRRFVFLVDSADDLAPADTKAALRSLRSLIDSLNCSCLFAFNESNLGALQLEFSDAVLLVVRPLELAAVRTFLSGSRKASDKRLRRLIDERGLGDLASAPWLLGQMRDQVQFGHVPNCRAEVMELVVEDFLGAFGSRGIPRRCAIEALRNIAWKMQSSRCRSISNLEMWKILDEARGTRDFRLADLRDALVAGHLLVPAGEEASGLSYSAIRGYFTARYLIDSPQSTVLLEDITASLGRLSRIRHWEDTLIMYAGLQRSAADRERMLKVLLAGSSLIEGEQVFLASRLYIEMRQSGPEDESALASTPVVRQMLDTLVWRSRPDQPRPYQDRRRSVECLAAMRHPDAIPHLVALACDKWVIPFDSPPKSGEVKNPPRLDYSGIRMLAVAGLLDQPRATSAFIARTREDLLPVLSAWTELLARGEIEPMMAILQRNDAAISSLAAFAFALERDQFDDSHPLLRAFWNVGTDPEILWGITEVFGKMDAGWLRDRIIVPWIRGNPEPDRRLCYLIQKSAYAPAGSPQRAYLEDCLRNPDVAARAVRAIAKISETDARTGHRELCHQILRDDWAGALAAAGIQRPQGDEMTWKMRHSALEALRDVGDETSVDLLREVRTRFNSVLAQLSFQVAEEIYWRCTGGLTKENFEQTGE